MCAINKTSVVQIIHEDLKLKCLKSVVHNSWQRPKKTRAWNDASSCWTSFQSTSASPCLQMKIYSQWRHLSMLKMIAWTYLSQERSVMLVPSCYLQPLSHDRPTRSNLATGLNRAVLCAPGVMVYGTNYRDVLLIDAEHAASDQIHVGRLHRLSARHRSSTSGTGHCCVATPRDCRIDWTRTLVSKLSRPQSSWLNDLGFDTRTCLPTSIRDIDDLKQRLISVWSELKQSVVDKAIDQWRARPRACIRAKGKHFEHPTRPYIRSNKNLVETCFFS